MKTQHEKTPNITSRHWQAVLEFGIVNETVPSMMADTNERRTLF